MPERPDPEEWTSIDATDLAPVDVPSSSPLAAEATHAAADSELFEEIVSIGPPAPLPSGSELHVADATTTRVLAVTGAKGGVGKSVIAANVALYLASIGRKVLLVDADSQGAHLHTIVGGVRPRDLSRGRIEVPVPGLSLFVAGLDEGLSAQRRPESLDRLLGAIRDRDARFVDQDPPDYVVVDLGAASSKSVVDAYLRADLDLFVTLPEPTALESTYRFLARTFLRRLLGRLEEAADRDVVSAHVRTLGGSPFPLELWRSLEDEGEEVADLVRVELDAWHPALVMNQTRLRADLDLGEAVRSIVRRRLGITIEYIGHVEHDDTVWSCVRARRLLLIESPGTKASKNIERIARRLLARESGKHRPPTRVVPPESHHDLLEVERGATDEDVRRAYKRMKEIYEDEALAPYALFSPPELRALRTRLDEAYDVLLDPGRRRPYELSIFPPDAAEVAHAAREALPDEPLPRAPDITPDTDFTGALLRAVRESRGVRLEDIAQKTKVGLVYLHAIEGDDFDALPAPVYVRGFVVEMAKYLELDSGQVSRTYLRRLKRHLEDPSRVRGASR